MTFEEFFSNRILLLLRNSLVRYLYMYVISIQSKWFCIISDGKVILPNGCFFLFFS